MDLFYLGIFGWVVAVVGAVANFATVEMKRFSTTAFIHLMCGLIGGAGTLCMIIWGAQMLYALANKGG